MELGYLLQRRDARGLRDAHQQAVVSGEHDLAASAMMALAQVLHQQGDISGARSA
jgi:hypothetical protein